MEIIKYNELSNRKRNLVSLSIFKMKDGYRNFNIYLNYLQKILNYFRENKNLSLDLRIYFDESCHKEINKFISENRNIEFYKFNYPPLRIGEFHNGTFGTLARLLPIFNNQHNYSKDYDYVWIDDIDISPENIQDEQIDYLYANNINTFYSSLFCYYKPWNNVKYGKYNLNFPLITNIKIPLSIFNKYINDVSIGTYKNVISSILEYRKDRYKYNYDIKFPYGMDEYFTNNIIFENLCNKITFVRYDIEISRILTKILYTKVLDPKDKEILKLLLKLSESSYKNTDLKVKKEINNTFIKLFNKIDKNKMQSYFDSITELNEMNCVNEFYDFINKYKIDDINNFYVIVKIKL
jgi:hypothetical protein